MTVDLAALGISEALTQKMRASRELTDKLFGKLLNCYVPSDLFPSISVTGAKCALMCNHCRGILLERMVGVRHPEELVAIGTKLYQNGAKGFLITGGCDASGRVPVEAYTAAIKELKHSTDLIIIAHTGFIDNETATQLKVAGLDGVAFDVVGSPETVRKVYGLEVSEDDYLSSLAAIRNADLALYPHVCVGLDFGTINGEYRALEMVSDFSPATIIITGLMALKKTPMEGYKPPVIGFPAIISEANLRYRDIPITLGCAHSTGKDRELIEQLAFMSGVVNIAVPGQKVLRIAEKEGYDVRWYGTCCGVPPSPATRTDLHALSLGEWIYHKPEGR